MIKVAIVQNMFFVYELSNGLPSTAMYFTELPVGSLPPMAHPVSQVCHFLVSIPRWEKKTKKKTKKTAATFIGPMKNHRQNKSQHTVAYRAPCQKCIDHF